MGQHSKFPILLMIDQSVTDNAPVYAAKLTEMVRRGDTTFMAEWAKVLPPERCPQNEADAARRFWYRAGLASARALAVSYAWQQAERRKVGQPHGETMFDQRVQKAIDFASAAAAALSISGDPERADLIVRRARLAKADSADGVRYRHRMLDQVGRVPAAAKRALAR